MKIRTKYILFVVVLHFVTLVLSYFIFFENKLLFIASELFIIASIVVSRQLYLQLIQPIRLLMQGVDAIRDRDFNVKLRPTGSVEMDELIQVYNRMIDALREERTKQEEQHFFLEKMINTSPTGIIVLDYDDQIRQVNPKTLELTGQTELSLIGKHIIEIKSPLFGQMVELSSGNTKVITGADGATYKLQKSHFIDRGFARHFIMIEEITAEILAAEKRTYGKVIRMMAHEVNNTIGPVNSILGSALDKRETNSQLANAFQVAIERNNNLNLFMRNFADLVRIPVPQKRIIDIVQLTRNVTELMRARSDDVKQISFVHEHETDVLEIYADASQMEQVLINIIKNSIEAIEFKGTIAIISTASKRQMVIRDDGSGISRESEENLFSPFYSSKRDGQGVGLTLIREILMNHQFDLSLKTIAPNITEFRIFFS